MSFDYTSVRASAVAMIDEFGADKILRKHTSTAGYDPTVTTSDTTITAVATGYKLSQIDGSVIKRGDIQFLFYSTTAPDEDDHIIDGSDDYSIEGIDIVKPGSTVVIYKVQGRLL